MIYDKKEFDSFVNWLPETISDEVYFVSLSARNKYLTENERLQLCLGRTEMFSRCISYDKAGLDYALKKMEASLLYRKTKNGSEIPRHALVVYINVNPSSTLEAYKNFVVEYQSLMFEHLRGIERGMTPNMKPWHRIERGMLNHIQKSRGRRLLIDVDCDTHDKRINDDLTDFLSEADVTFMKIRTRGGYHYLLFRSTMENMNGNQNLHSKLKILETSCGSEIVINKNGMVPVPGTLQANVPVIIEQLRMRDAVNKSKEK